jgi:putative membrane protein
LTGTNGARFFGIAPFLFVLEATVDAPGNRHVLDHLSNERTLLAWIRTSIAVIALGIAINRVSLFLMEIHQLVPELRAVADRHIKGLGVGLIVLGIVVLVGAFWHYLRVSRAIDAETYRPSTLAMGLTSAAIVVMGAIALVWLF